MEPKDLLDRFIDHNGRGMTLEDIVKQVGPGWRVLVEALVKDLFELGWDGRLYQIKEKFGGLRFYTGSVSDEAYERIDQAEQLSLETCEECGSPGTTGEWDARHYVRTLCNTHGEAERVKK